MITISQEPDGSTTISIESPGERRLMHETYEGQDKLLKRLWIAEHATEGDKEPSSSENEEPFEDRVYHEPAEPDEARLYRLGVAHAVAAADIAYQNGDIESFFEANLEGYVAPAESGLPDVPAPMAAPQVVGRDEEGRLLIHDHEKKTVTPMWEETDYTPVDDLIVPDEELEPVRTVSRRAHNHGVPIAATDATPEQIEEKGAETVVKAAGPGEPIPNTGGPIDGNYVIPAAELESLRDEEYRRGRADGIEAGVNVNKTIEWAGVERSVQQLFMQKAADQFGDPGSIPPGSSLQINPEEILRHVLKSVGYTIIELPDGDPVEPPEDPGIDPGEGADGWG